MTTDAERSAVPVIAEGRGFLRLRPEEAAAALRDGALLVDVRRIAARRRDGDIPGALVVAGPLRDWRLGPDSPERVCELGDRRAVVVICERGETSVLVASALYGMGVTGATDVVGGFAGWLATGLPVTEGGTLCGRVVTPAESQTAAAPVGALV
jgi:rhodanese-related sulfurtransferase